VILVGSRLLASDHGNPFVGFYCAASDSLALIGPSASPKFLEACEKALGVPIHTIPVADSNLLGLYCTLNSNGVILPEQATKHEVKKFKDLGLNTMVLQGRLNACGNIITANDKGALAHPLLEKADVKEISDCLGVEVVQAKLAGYFNVGAICVATNKGFAAHNKLNDEELSFVEGILKVPGAIATANLGVSFIRPCVVVNSKGYVAGNMTSGYETSRLDEAFGFIDQ
jgi:translation initiation factor 6